MQQCSLLFGAWEPGKPLLGGEGERELLLRLGRSDVGAWPAPEGWPTPES